MKVRSQRARTYQGNNLTNGTVLPVGIYDRGDVHTLPRAILSASFYPLVISVRFQFLEGKDIGKNKSTSTSLLLRSILIDCVDEEIL